ncbi:MAG TPA: hypothetical protein VNL91_10515 [Thermoanaerobaculia bacterium]|nr:hypothetical protein [Thermoanaerobaculia bacterium]
MSDRKGWGKTVIGWFIVPEEQAQGDLAASPVDDPATEEIIRRAAAAEPLPVFKSAPPPAATGGRVDFDQVFEAAGITSDERERISRTLELLNSLPAGTDEAVKKQIVMASLRAFGVPIEQIIETGAEELQALEAYIRGGAADVEKLTMEAEQKIREFEQEIANLRQMMQQRVAEQNAVVRVCNSKKLEVQKVLEFFGQEAVAKVVHESPKLHEPAAS